MVKEFLGSIANPVRLENQNRVQSCLESGSGQVTVRKYGRLTLEQKERNELSVRIPLDEETLAPWLTR